MKLQNQIYYIIFITGRKKTIKNKLITNLLMCIIILLSMLLLTESCKKRDNTYEKTDINEVTWEDVKTIDYPNEQRQKEVFDEFKHIIESTTIVENPDKILRQMTENISLYYIQELLQKLSQTTSVKEKPNISAFLQILNEMKNLDEANAIIFIDKAKENSNSDMLCIALYGLHNESQQARAADALAIIKKPESVSLLTKRLLMAGVMLGSMGGTESQYITSNLCRSLVKALESCTGLSFPDYNPENKQETLVIAKRCQEWLEEHPQKD